MTVLTPPIKVISKPEQLRKKKTPAVPPLPSLSTPSIGIPNPLVTPALVSPSTKKRSLTEILMDVVTRIEQKQADQQRAIERMLDQQTAQATSLDTAQRKMPKVDPLSIFCWSDTDFTNVVNPLSLLSSAEHTTSNANPTTTTTTSSLSTSSTNSNHEVPDFEVSFINLLKAYQQLPPEQRSAAIRGALRESSTKDVEKISEILDLFWSEGFQNQTSRTTTLLSDSGTFSTGDSSTGNLGSHDPETCTCADCPHKQELERIDEFYKDFLSQQNQNLSFSFDPNA
jgi:hypothetical protein